jgi:diguanylate cyclase (GGDEF)-like protein
VIMCDLDQFKEINDQCGHPAGDVVLQDIARRLAGGVRAEDDVGRYGGEEFVIILPDCDGPAALPRAERLRRAVECASIPFATASLHLTCSFGVSWTFGGPSDGERLVQEADDALYRAKQAGRNCVVLADTPAGARLRTSNLHGHC